MAKATKKEEVMFDFEETKEEPKKATPKKTTATKTTPKKTTVKATPKVEEVKEEVVEEVVEKPVEADRPKTIRNIKKSKFDEKDLVPCKSVTSGGLALSAQQAHGGGAGPGAGAGPGTDEGAAGKGGVCPVPQQRVRHHHHVFRGAGGVRPVHRQRGTVRLRPAHTVLKCRFSGDHRLEKTSYTVVTKSQYRRFSS